MKRFRITLLVEHSTEIDVPDAQAAHNEATRLATAHVLPGEKPAILHSIEEITPKVVDLGPLDDMP